MSDMRRPGAVLSEPYHRSSTSGGGRESKEHESKIPAVWAEIFSLAAHRRSSNYFRAARHRDRSSRRPALRLAHHEVAEHLHPRHRLQLFGIDEIGIELDRVGLAEQLHQPVVFLDQIIRQRRDAEALLAGAHQAEDIVDLEIGF